MNSELKYAKDSRPFWTSWFVFYPVVLILAIVALYLFGMGFQSRIIPVGKVVLSVPYSKYLLGETVTFTIKNNFNSPIFIINQCPKEPLEVYRLEGGKWTRLHDSAPLAECQTENREIQISAGQSASGSFGPWKSLFAQPGKYRIVAYVDYYNALPYQDIEIIAPPKPSPAQVPARSSSPAIRRATQTPTPYIPTHRFNPEPGEND